jgi:hypothetical protein
MKIYIATITILIKDRHAHIAPVNKLLTEYGHIVIARLGVSLERQCLKGCTGLISIAAEGTKLEIEALTKKINKLKNTKAKNTFIS